MIKNEQEIYNIIKEKRNLQFEKVDFNDLNLFRFNPFKLTNIQAIKYLLETHKKFNSKILIFCDYDVDGVTSGFILYDYLKKNNYNINIQISKRDLGYGFSNLEVEQIINDNYNLVITTDLGINENEHINKLQKNGVEVIVTDHHKNNDFLPNCLWLNAKMCNRYFSNNLSGAGIIWKLINFLDNKPVIDYLDIVAISNIADSVPLVNENRVITKLGLKKLNNQPFPTIEKMLDVFNINHRITENDIGYKIAPAINSVNRLKYSDIPLQILMGNNIKENTKEMIRLNNKRKKETDNLIKNLDIDTSHNIIIVKGDFRQGFTGLVANKLMDRYNLPVVVLNSNLRGSSRSINPLKITEVLEKKENEFFNSLGGHDYASGFTLKEDKFEQFKAYLYAKTKGLKYEIQKEDITLQNLNFINEDLIKLLENLQPFGNENPIPLFKIENVKLDNYRLTRDKEHLQFTLETVRGIWFNYNKKINLDKKLTLYFEIQKDNYKNEGVQLIIKRVE